jgi:lipopolysaccharide assembly outer membrane protein LptD (OstA)
VVNFEIPWKITFTHIYSINANTTKTASNSNNFRQVQTISTNGDLSFTKRWKIIGTVNFDVQTVKITYTTLTLTRDMHCWNLSFNWIPIGQNQSFLFSLRSTSSMFKDAKFDLRKPPLFF